MCTVQERWWLRLRVLWMTRVGDKRTDCAPKWNNEYTSRITYHLRPFDPNRNQSRLIRISEIVPYLSNSRVTSGFHLVKTFSGPIVRFYNIKRRLKWMSAMFIASVRTEIHNFNNHNCIFVQTRLNLFHNIIYTLNNK